MKNVFFGCFLAITIILISCSEEKKASVNVDFTSLSMDVLPVEQIQSGIADSIRRKSVNALELEISKPLILSVGERKKTYVFLQPGETIKLTNSNEDSTKLDFVGEVSTENKYLQEYAKLDETAETNHELFPLSKNEPALFFDSLAIKYSGLEALIEKLKNDTTVNPDFSVAMQERLLSKKATELILYPEYYNYNNKAMPDLADDYYKFLDDIDIDSKTLLTFSEGRMVGDEIAGRDINYEDFESTSDYFADKLKKVASTFTNKTNRDYFTFVQMESLINFGGGIDGLDDMIIGFRNSTDNKLLLASIAAVVSPWLSLKSGKIAPEFSGYTRDGKQVNISSLKGKNVYVDVWATWCGPCIREIPALKEIENLHHDQNIEFVSISIDQQKDADKWRKFVEDKELRGTQIMADKDWRSEVVAKYNIKGIPRFILIDEKGIIVKADAPRPSDPKLLEFFEDLDLKSS